MVFFQQHATENFPSLLPFLCEAMLKITLHRVRVRGERMSISKGYHVARTVIIVIKSKNILGRNWKKKSLPVNMLH